MDSRMMLLMGLKLMAKGWSMWHKRLNKFLLVLLSQCGTWRMEVLD